MEKRTQHASNIQEWRIAESSARHGVVVFLVIFSLVDIDIMSKKTEEERRNATQLWLAWGIPFLLLAFFIITPEQEAKQRSGLRAWRA